MRLRALKFPVAVLDSNGLMGGSSAALTKPSRWNFVNSKHFFDGGYEDSVFYDSTGTEYSVDKIFRKR